jgi:hypothetical protein
MAGIKLVTDVDADRLVQLAWRTAQDLGFKLTPVKDAAFAATKGHALWSLVAGAAALKCDFKVSTHHYADGTTDLMLERDGSWLMGGMLGDRRARNEADTLMQKVADAIAQSGGKVIERKEI